MCADFAAVRRVLRKGATWSEMQRDFRWNIPADFNIARACCDSWAGHDAARIALIHLDTNGDAHPYSYGDLREKSDRLASVFSAHKLAKGDVCALLLAQCPEVLISHFACFKSGVVSLPLFTLFGADGLAFRLSDSGARAIITDRANLPKVLTIRDQLPDLRQIWCIDGAADGARDFHGDIARASGGFAPQRCTADTVALMSYTSGTTGPPKGVLHAHRFLIGHLPSIELHHDFFPSAGDKTWTPADWAWIGGLMNMALPSLYYGVPLVSHRMAKFDPDYAFDLIAKTDIRNMFLPPTALRLMQQTKVPKDVAIRSVGSGGESLGGSLLEWGQAALGVTINELYGQTECNLVLCGSHQVLEPRAGAIGRAVPGHQVAVIDSDGQDLPRGTLGEIAVHRDSPGMFLGYLNQPSKTAEKFVGDWMRTGDLGVMDDDGYVTFSARDDDVITSSGYRIGPSEIEDCLCGHADVVMAAAVGIPDPLRTEVVKAFVVLAENTPHKNLEAALIRRVRTRLSPHVAPRSISFIDHMPMTATGKIMRRVLRDAEPDVSG